MVQPFPPCCWGSQRLSFLPFQLCPPRGAGGPGPADSWGPSLRFQGLPYHLAFGGLREGEASFCLHCDSKAPGDMCVGVVLNPGILKAH